MQEYEILIEENAFGATRPVRVRMDVPVSMLLPELVEILNLPMSDLFGNSLIYALYHASSGRKLPREQTLEASGILPGMCLKLEILQPDGVAIPVASQVMNASASPQPPMNYDLYVSDTLSDGVKFSALSSEQLASEPEAPTRQQRHTSRRAFLITCGVVLGSAGVGYAAYRGVTSPGLFKIALSSASKVVAQQKPQPTKATQVKKTTAPTPFTVKLQTTFKKHQNVVRVVSWSPLSTFLVSASDDSHVFIWDQQGNVQQDLQHPAAVRSLALSPDATVAVTGANNQVAFWSTQTGNRVSLSQHQHTQLVTALAWTTKNMQQIVSVSQDTHAIIWSPKSFQPLLTYQKHTAALTAVSWSSDGQTVASASQGGVVHVWRAADGQDLHGFYQDAAVPMRAIAFDPVGTRLAVGGDDGIVRLWNGLVCTKDGQQCMDTPQRIVGAKVAVRAVSWSPDGKFLAIGMDNGMLQLLQTAQNMKQVFVQNLGDIVRSIAWSADSKKIATAVGKQVMLWNVT